ncbi:MAG: tetratricopeptide repeat protein [Gammaproteobacteria bacterium]|nr:tetratricopeptide repeat protein [Gammaproteobacteria bacterium]
MPPHSSPISRLIHQWAPLRHIWVVGACVIIASCSNTPTALVTQPNTAPKTLINSSLNHLLAGEFSLYRGDSQAAAEHLLAAAQATQDLNTTKRATYAAKVAKNPHLLKQASVLWSQLAPKDPLPWQYIAQAESLNKNFGPAAVALEQELKRGGGAGVVYVANLGINETEDIQKRLRERFYTWLQSYPKHKHLLYSLATLTRNSEPFDIAIGYTSQALAVDPHYLKAQILYGELLLASHQTTAADNYLSQHTSPLDKAHRHLLALHAQVLTLTAQYERAYRYFNELVRRFPNDLSFRYSAGLLAYETQKYTLAQAHFEQAIKTHPQSHSAYYYLGLGALEQEFIEQAISYFHKVTTGAERINAITMLANLEQPTGTETAHYFLQWRQQHPDLSADIYQVQAQYSLGLGDIESATNAFETALKKHPNHVALLYSYALLAQSLLQYDTTEHLLARIIEIDPNHINALNALGYSYAEQGINLNHAESLIRRALQHEPENAAIIDSLGWVTYRQGHLRKALALLSKAYDILPDTEIAAHLGAVQWALGDIDGAFNTWNAALKLDPNSSLIKQAILDAQNDFQND